MATAAISLIVLGAFLAGSIWYFKRIRDGRADPVVNPGWPSIMNPTPLQFHSDGQPSSGSSLMDGRRSASDD
jgi:hypothetical protein